MGIGWQMAFEGGGVQDRSIVLLTLPFGLQYTI